MCVPVIGFCKSCRKNISVYDVYSYLTERALFLKNKLDNLPENQGHLLNNVGKSVEDELEQLKTENFILE